MGYVKHMLNCVYMMLIASNKVQKHEKTIQKQEVDPNVLEKSTKGWDFGPYATVSSLFWCWLF